MSYLSRCLIALLMLSSFGTVAEAKLAELLVTDRGKTKPIDLTNADIDVNVAYSSALVSYDLTFRSSHNRPLEGTFYFSLPRESYVHEFGYWVEGHYQRSAIVEAKAGRHAYETIVRRGVDPALLEWTAGNNFKMRVFPVNPGAPTRVKIVVGIPLSMTNLTSHLYLPLDMGKVQSLQLNIEGITTARSLPEVRGLKVALKDNGSGKFSGKVQFKNLLPPDLLTLRFQEKDPYTVKVRRVDGEQSRFFEARVFPRLTANRRPAPQKSMVFWDFSLSESAHHKARLHALDEYLKSRKPSSVDIYGFHNKVFKVATIAQPTPERARVAIERFQYDGGTRIDKLLDSLAGVAKTNTKWQTDLVIFTNGLDSYELFDFDKVRSIAGERLHAFLVTPTMGANTALLNKISRSLSAIVIDQDQEEFGKAYTDYPWTLTFLKSSKRVNELEGPNQSTLHYGDGLVLRGKVKDDGAVKIQATFEQGSKKKTLTFDADTDDVTREDTKSLPRLWAAQKIDRLLPEKRANRALIQDLALTHQLMSPYTVMVVLETCEDYREFKLTPPKDCRSRPEPVAGFFGGEDYEDEYAEVEDGGSEARTIDFDAVEIAGQRKRPLSDLEDASAADYGGGYSADPAPAGESADYGVAPPPSSLAPPQDDAAITYGDYEAEGDYELMDESEEYGDEYGDYGGRRPQTFAEWDKQTKDSVTRPFGFESALDEAAKRGARSLYETYTRNRGPYEKIPFYYIYTADKFSEMKRPDLADQVLSNVVEVRPGEARWLRIYAYNLMAWQRAKDAMPIYRAITELREEDPQGFRDFGLAMEKIGEPLAAMNLFEKVYNGKWDDRLRGIRDIVRHDLSRAASKVAQYKNANANAKKKAVRYAAVDKAHNDKLVVTATWDTDNTDIDLHVLEPHGEHVYYGNRRPNSTKGTLSFDTTQGFGPEQYRNPTPYNGPYRFYLTYYSSDPNVIKDGTFVRVDVKIIENGKKREFTKTLYLKESHETRTVLRFDYNDRNAPTPPINFATATAQVKAMLKAKQFTQAMKLLNKLGERKSQTEEATRQFHMARAYAGLRQYGKAEEHNQLAIANNPRMVAAYYNNACYASLAGQNSRAFHHLKLMMTVLERRGRREQTRFYRLMQTDPDLKNIRQSAEFRKVMSDITRLAH